MEHREKKIRDDAINSKMLVNHIDEASLNLLSTSRARCHGEAIIVSYTWYRTMSIQHFDPLLIFVPVDGSV